MLCDRKRNLFGASVLLMLILAWTGTGYPADLIVYLSPNGNNQADGLTRGTPVASLQIAIDRALQKADAPHERLRIVVEPGEYVGQTAVTKGSAEGKPLVIGPEKEGERPRFVGSGKGETWLTLNSSKGKPTRVTVEGLEIAKYLTAISLHAARTDVAASNSQNIIRNNIFRDIGQISNPSAEPSTAAVRLVNSDDNQILNNQFINIRNTKKCGGLHAIYIAHYSTGNKIEQNVFDGGCGATIKVRDGSNNNLIANNEFRNQEDFLFKDSFCDKDMREDCSKDEGECPSWNNEFRDNTIRGLYKISKPGRKVQTSPVKVVQSKNPSGCSAPKSNTPRVKESGTKTIIQ